jgi:predicted enzyme related to lactoylglutathione lyase
MKVEAVKVVLMTADMGRAIAFWSVFGFQERFRDDHWSEVALGDVILGLHGGGDGRRNPTGLSLQVDDVSEAVRRAREAGATVEREPEDRPGEPIKLADLVDPEGNVFMLTQYVG